MGNVIRSYWLPILLSRELEADGKALRMRIMGEDLIAFRDTNGTVGVLDELCAHRGASLYYARNENCALQCVYHGWKYDVNGQCVETPNEPPESNFKDKVRLTSYSTSERSGVVWVYMGTRTPPPPLPALEWSLLPDDHVYASKVVESCNWAQALEGGIDSSHISFLHAEAPNGPVDPVRLHQSLDRHPRYEVVDTAFGSLMSARRNVDDGYYYRVTPFLMPFYTMIPGRIGDNSQVTGHAWLPIDDENTLVWTITWDATRPLSDAELEKMRHYSPQSAGIHLPVEFLAPETPEAWGAWHPKPTRANDYLRDLEREKALRFSGIPTIGVQDKAMQESMGKIFNRSRERLGAADTAIIKARQLWLESARAMRDRGAIPRGALEPDAYSVRSASQILRRGTEWVEAMRPMIEAPQRQTQPTNPG
jgi:phenylpropionate dioxygenase-like ring-hydroxylating dioxygenase large terminal subunit